MFSHRADEQAAIVFADVASSLDAALPIESLGGDPHAGDEVLFGLCEGRGVRLRPAEQLALRAGWQSGRPSLVLRQRAAARERRAKFSRTVQAALAYPMVLLLLLLLASLATMAITGPLLVAVLVVGYAVAGSCAYAALRTLRRGDAAAHHLPIAGPVVTELQELPYLEALHALYGAGVPIVEAHRAAFPTVHMQRLRSQLAQTQALLEDGKALREALETSGALCRESRTMLANGEVSGSLEEALERALDRRTEQAGRRLDAAARKLRALVYSIVVAGIVTVLALFYTNYYAPVFSMLRRS